MLQDGLHVREAFGMVSSTKAHVFSPEKSVPEFRRNPCVFVSVRFRVNNEFFVVFEIKRFRFVSPRPFDFLVDIWTNLFYGLIRFDVGRAMNHFAILFASAFSDKIRNEHLVEEFSEWFLAMDQQ